MRKLIQTGFLLMTSIAIGGFDASSQETEVAQKKSQLEVALDTVLGAAEGSVVAAAIKLTQNPREIFQSGCLVDQECAKLGDRAWLLDLAPKLDVKVGDNGAFQKINGALTGHFVFAETIAAGEVIEGLDNPNAPILRTDRFFHVVPVSVGFETSRFFKSAAGIGEVGYVPFFPNSQRSIFSTPLQLGLNPYLGVFLQGGYKFEGSNKILNGNSTDQSGENTNDWVARVKAEAKLDIKLPTLSFLSQSEPPKLMTWATGWYDIKNHNVHHSVGAKLRFKLRHDDKTNFDIKFENGSGEPNFNTGSQIAAGLSWSF